VASYLDAVDAAAESDDEVVDASNLEGLAGARVRVERSGSHCLGTVRSVSPGGSRMLVCCDADATEVWVGAEDAWDLDVSTPAAEQPAALPAFVDRGDGPPGFNPATQPPKPSAGESTPGSQEPQTGPRRMFRFIDTSVEPGKSYRYRVTLKIANPNVGIESQYLAEPALATDLQLAAPPSDATPAGRIPDPVMMLATRLDADDVRRLKLTPGMFELLVMAPSQKTGNYSLRSVVTETGGIANVDESLNRPGDLRFKGEKTTTNRVLLDVFGQQGELVAASPARGGRQTTQRSAGPAEPLEMIFRKPNGSLEIASAADSESRFARYRDTLYPADEASPEDDPGFGPGGPPLEGVPFNPFQTQPRR
jgi:hypothetical protein